MQAVAEDAFKILEALSSERIESKVRKDKWSKCPYCKDKMFVQVRLDHFLMEKIPANVDPGIGSIETIAVPCDCHPTDGKAFAFRFGNSVASSPLGSAILRETRQNQQQEEEAMPF